MGFLCAGARAEALQPWQMVRSLQLLQDRIADGDQAALPMQRRLLTMTDGRLRKATRAELADLRNFDAVMVYAMGGGNPATVQALMPDLLAIADQLDAPLPPPKEEAEEEEGAEGEAEAAEEHEPAAEGEAEASGGHGGEDASAEEAGHETKPEPPADGHGEAAGGKAQEQEAGEHGEPAQAHGAAEPAQAEAGDEAAEAGHGAEPKHAAGGHGETAPAHGAADGASHAAPLAQGETGHGAAGQEAGESAKPAGGHRAAEAHGEAAKGHGGDEAAAAGAGHEAKPELPAGGHGEPAGGKVQEASGHGEAAEAHGAADGAGHAPQAEAAHGAPADEAGTTAKPAGGHGEADAAAGHDGKEEATHEAEPEDAAGGHGEAAGEKAHGDAAEGHGEAAEAHGKPASGHGEAEAGHGEAKDGHGGAKGGHGDAEDGGHAPVPKAGQKRKLALGVFNYGRGRFRDAEGALGLVDPMLERAEVGAYVALIQGTLKAGGDPAGALKALDTARLIAPGTLVEEAALRRSVALAAALGDRPRFLRASGQYVRRFLRSPYASQFADGFVAGAVVLQDGLDLDALGAVTAGMTPAQEKVVYLRIARRAAIDNLAGLSAYASAKAGAVPDAAANDAPEADPRAALYAALPDIAAPDTAASLKRLEAIDPAGLTASDRALLAAAKAVIGETLAEPPPPEPPAPAQPPQSKAPAAAAALAKTPASPRPQEEPPSPETAAGEEPLEAVDDGGAPAAPESAVRDGATQENTASEGAEPPSPETAAGEPAPLAPAAEPPPQDAADAKMAEAREALATVDQMLKDAAP